MLIVRRGPNAGSRFLLDHDLTQEHGELTPTLKMKRDVVNENYRPLFDALYANDN